LSRHNPRDKDTQTLRQTHRHSEVLQQVDTGCSLLVQ